MRIPATLSVCLLSLSFGASAIPSAIPTGVTYYDPARAWNGYVVIPGSDNQTHLIDMTGQEVHRWAYEGFPSWPIPTDRVNGQRGRRAALLPNDHLHIASLHYKVQFAEDAFAVYAHEHTQRMDPTEVQQLIA